MEQTNNGPLGVFIHIDEDFFPRDAKDELSVGHRAAAHIRHFKQHGIVVRYVSENSWWGQNKTLSRLHALDIPAEAEDLFLASNVAAKEIARRENRATVFLIGTEGLGQDLHRHGLRVIERPEEIDYLADYVVIGHDPGLHYDKLTRTLRCLRHGAQWAVVQDDLIIDSSGGPTPGPGATVAAVRELAQREPDFWLGKPRNHILRQAMRNEGETVSRWIIVSAGDTPLCDAASEAGIETMTFAEIDQIVS